jgi:hypothetical protein
LPRGVRDGKDAHMLQSQTRDATADDGVHIAYQVASSAIGLDDAGEHELKAVPDRWRLYRVVD